MNKRGWLASGFLVVAVIGGYLGLLPLLSSLASGPAWPEPIASKEASGVVTAADPASGSEPSTTVTVEQTPAPEVVANQPETPAPGDETSGQKQEPAVVRVVDGDIDRVEQPKKKTAPSNGSGSGSSNGGNSSSGARNDAITPQPSGGNGGGTPAPPSGASADAFDGVSAGELAGGTGAGSDSGDEITSGDPGATTTP